MAVDVLPLQNNNLTLFDIYVEILKIFVLLVLLNIIRVFNIILNLQTLMGFVSTRTRLQVSRNVPASHTYYLKIL